MWLTEYKNNEDYKKRLMASNLIGGWFQRLDGTGARKVAFGNVSAGLGQKKGNEECSLVSWQDVMNTFWAAILCRISAMHRSMFSPQCQAEACTNIHECALVLSVRPSSLALSFVNAFLFCALS